MKILLISVLVISVLPLLTTTIRCYKCDATNECKIMTKDSSIRSYDDSSDNVEVVDCEYNCWKSISLGNKINIIKLQLIVLYFLGNVYRGCAKKRCALSHTIGTFSSSVCCQTDYCNSSIGTFAHRQYCLLAILMIILSILIYSQY